MMKSSEIRNSFVDYFKKHGHTHVGSSSLIPENDPTLMFANSGMNQFKNLFQGHEQRNYTKAVTVQKCLRKTPRSSINGFAVIKKTPGISFLK